MNNLNESKKEGILILPPHYNKKFSYLGEIKNIELLNSEDYVGRRMFKKEDKEDIKKVFEEYWFDFMSTRRYKIITFKASNHRTTQYLMVGTNLNDKNKLELKIFGKEIDYKYYDVPGDFYPENTVLSIEIFSGILKNTENIDISNNWKINLQQIINSVSQKYIENIRTISENYSPEKQDIFYFKKNASGRTILERN